MSTPIFVRLGLWTWFLAALAAAHQGWLRPLLGPALPALSATLAAGALVLYFRARPLRDWADALDARALVLLHAARAYGAYFLVLGQRGEIAPNLALTGGWGEIVVAALALPAALLPLKPALRRSVLATWNVIGAVGLVMLLLSIGRVGSTMSLYLLPFADLPMGLLTAFLFPLLLASHVVLHLRLSRVA